jgi:parallel beta-helix repeat protein
LNNKFEGCGLFVRGSRGNKVENNIVNGKPLIYFENAEDKEITNAGQVILIKCKEIIVKNCNLSYTTVGVEICDSSDCKIENNKIWENNLDGIYLEFSSSNTITNNSASNNLDGIYLTYFE